MASTLPTGGIFFSGAKPLLDPGGVFEAPPSGGKSPKNDNDDDDEGGFVASLLDGVFVSGLLLSFLKTES